MSTQASNKICAYKEDYNSTSISNEIHDTSIPQMETPAQIFAVASFVSNNERSTTSSQIDFLSQDYETNNSISNPVQEVISQLEEAGFNIHYVSSIIINFSGTRQQFQHMFNTTLSETKNTEFQSWGRDDKTHYYERNLFELPGIIPIDGTIFSDVLEGVSIDEPMPFVGLV